MHQKRHQPLHQVQPLQQPQQPLPRHTSVNRHGVVVALEDDDLDLLQVRMICNVQWVKVKQLFSPMYIPKRLPYTEATIVLKKCIDFFIRLDK